MNNVKFLFDAFANDKNESSVSAKLRKKRFAQFVETLAVKSSDRILDVGGAESTWIKSGLEERVTLLNLKFNEKTRFFRIYVQMRAICI